MNNEIEKGIDVLAEAATLSKDLKKMTAMKTAKAYGKLILAAAKVTPVCIALGGTPAISQAQVRHPDVELHIPSQSQDTNVGHEVKTIEGSTGLTPVSASASINCELLAAVSRQLSIQVDLN